MVLGMGYYEITKELCERNNVKISQLEKACGFGNGTIGKWKKSEPRADKLQEVAKYFHVPLSVFGIDENDIKKDPPTDIGGLSGREKTIIEIFRGLSLGNQQLALNLLDTLQKTADPSETGDGTAQ